MICVRVPLRICLGGGGTDLPEYYRKDMGFVLSATINKYITVRIEPGERMKVRCAQNEYARAAGWADTDLACIEGDVTAGSGLGGSGALMVALLKARYPELSGRELGLASYNIERYSLGRPVGCQDHLVAAYGGVVGITIWKDGVVHVQREQIPDGFADRLLLFNTGIRRESKDVLSAQVQSVDFDSSMREVYRTGLDIVSDLRITGGSRFGELTHRHWLAKKASCKATTTDLIDEWYEAALKHGALGGKCIGAGAGGFLLLVCDPENRESLAQFMTNQVGLAETPFEFVSEGATEV